MPVDPVTILALCSTLLTTVHALYEGGRKAAQYCTRHSTNFKIELETLSNRLAAIGELVNEYQELLYNQAVGLFLLHLTTLRDTLCQCEEFLKKFHDIHEFTKTIAIATNGDKYIQRARILQEALTDGCLDLRTAIEMDQKLVKKAADSVKPGPRQGQFVLPVACAQDGDPSNRAGVEMGRGAYIDSASLDLQSFEETYLQLDNQLKDQKIKAYYRECATHLADLGLVLSDAKLLNHMLSEQYLKVSDRLEKQGAILKEMRLVFQKSREIFERCQVTKLWFWIRWFATPRKTKLLQVSDHVKNISTAIKFRIDQQGQARPAC